uniref:Uncharacterized protein n=1 Tax=Oryza glumipatula TaxID=40148 RepID=A0A0E0AUN9_9ORYZ
MSRSLVTARRDLGSSSPATTSSDDDNASPLKLGGSMVTGLLEWLRLKFGPPSSPPPGCWIGARSLMVANRGDSCSHAPILSTGVIQYISPPRVLRRRWQHAYSLEDNTPN